MSNKHVRLEMSAPNAPSFKCKLFVPLGPYSTILHAQVASYMRAVLRTLSQCHHHKILHRDIKPGGRRGLAT